MRNRWNGIGDSREDECISANNEEDIKIINMNTNSTNKENKNPYGHLLDKYLDSNHVDWKTRQEREEEAKRRYGHLIGIAKPDNSTLERMAKIEDDRIERRKQMEEERKLDALRRQERIEAEKRKEDEHNAMVKGYAESVMARKEAKVRAAEMEQREKREAEEMRQRMHGNISGLVRINPKLAEEYLQTLKKHDII